jgi:hypothetical protein
VEIVISSDCLLVTSLGKLSYFSKHGEFKKEIKITTIQGGGVLPIGDGERFVAISNKFENNKIYDAINFNGSFWISDMVFHDTPAIQELMWERYGEHLESLGGKDYRTRVFDYIDKEDSPRSLTYQLALMKKVGFEKIEVLHKSSCFAAFGGVKTRSSYTKRRR